MQHTGTRRQDIIRRLRSAGCVFAEEEADLLLGAAADAEQLENLVDRRVSGLPLEHLLGWADFCGLRIAVDPGVFVPRRRTEYLVRRGATLLRELDAGPGRPPVVVDLCCGSGAVGAALVAAAGPLEMHAADLDPAAVACARRNLSAPGAAAHTGDLFEALPEELRGRVDLLAVNAPYVPTDAIAAMPPEARLHEPRISLDGGADGLALHRRIAAGAAEWLTPGGWLLIETSRSQARATRSILTDNGFAAWIRTSAALDATLVESRLPPGA
ncbi:putative protein N(5)-glutamine methyltransferase [Arthrobacter sp. NPDC080082]|uniref:putative protein N(5)-glutamine methyltransferase n=1 Tax=unclassified Arthrobacter TaxID=235627 RepID=UPI003440E894